LDDELALMATPVTIAQAALTLGVHRRTVQARLTANPGAIVRAGRRGRNGETLIDLAVLAPAVAKPLSDDPLLKFAALIPALTARVILENYRKRPSRARAADLAALWFELASQLSVAAVAGELAEVPADIRLMEKLACGISI
jgi:hypothetical protein